MASTSDDNAGMTPLRALLHDPHFRRGARDMLDFAPGIAAWGLVTGVAMAKSGLSLPLAVKLLRQMETQVPSDADALTAKLDTAFGVLLVAGLVIQGLMG